MGNARARPARGREGLGGWSASVWTVKPGNGPDQCSPDQPLESVQLCPSRHTFDMRESNMVRSPLGFGRSGMDVITPRQTSVLCLLRTGTLQRHSDMHTLLGQNGVHHERQYAVMDAEVSYAGCPPLHGGVRASSDAMWKESSVYQDGLELNRETSCNWCRMCIHSRHASSPRP